MRVAVTGATGNLGSALLRQLVEDERIEEVVAIARRPPSRLPDKVRLVPVDTSTDELTPHLEGVDAVAHLAWIFQPTHRPVETWRVNVGGAVRLFEAAARAGVGALVYASSVGAYSPRTSDDPVDESWPTDGLPTAGYGREKAYLERVLDAFEGQHPEMRVVRLRPGFIFQAAAATEQRRLFAGPFAPTSLLRFGSPPVFPFPAGLRFQVLHADDAARAFHLALVGDVRGAFNIASSPVVDADVLGEVLGAKPLSLPPQVMRVGLTGAWWTHLVPVEPGLFDLAMGLPIMRTDSARLELGWEPHISAKEALREVVDAMARGAGGGSVPLAPDSMAKRAQEVAQGVGERQS